MKRRHAFYKLRVSSMLFRLFAILFFSMDKLYSLMLELNFYELPFLF